MIYKTSVKQNGTCDGKMLEDLLFRLADGDIGALETLYEAVRVPVYSFALSILKNSHDAEDVMHDCFVKIVDSAGAYTAQGKPMAWILTVTKNLCYNRIREYGKIAEIPEDWERTEADADVSPEDSLLLRACMEKLSDDECKIVTLHAVSGMKHRDIAALLSLPLNTVLSKYNRAIKKLRQNFEKEN